MIKIVHNTLGAGKAYDCSKFLDRGSSDISHRLEVFEQSIKALGPDAINLLQLALDKGVATLLTVERNTETVSLITYMANNLHLSGFLQTGQ